MLWCLCEVHTMSFLPKSIVLVDAIKRLSRRFLGMPHPRLLVGTWTGSKNCRYPTSVQARCLWHFPYNQSVLSHWHNTEISRVLFAKGSRTTLQRNREGLLTAMSGASYFSLPGWVGPALYELLKAVAWVVEGREGGGEEVEKRWPVVLTELSLPCTAFSLY